MGLVLSKAPSHLEARCDDPISETRGYGGPVNSCCLRFYWLASPVSCSTPQWGAANAEVKGPSGESAELKRSPFKAWSRSAYSHICNVYCQKFLPCLFLLFRSIQLHFFQTPPDFSSGCAEHMVPVNKIGHSAECQFPC